jgi:hypothetical protein
VDVVEEPPEKRKKAEAVLGRDRKGKESGMEGGFSTRPAALASALLMMEKGADQTKAGVDMLRIMFEL